MFRKEDKGEGPNQRLLPSSVQYIEWLRLSCTSVLLFVSGIYLQAVAMPLTLAALAAPAPISLIGIRQGVYKAFLAVIFVATALFLPFGYEGSVSFIFSAGFLGIIFAVVVKKANSAGETFLGLVITALAAKLMFMLFMINTRGTNPFVLDENSVSAIMNSFIAGASDDVLNTLAQQLNLLVPTFLIIAAGIDSFVNYFLVLKIENRRRQLRTASSSIAVNSADERTNELKIHPLPPLEQLSFPRSLLTAFLAAFLITLLDVSGTNRTLLSAELNLKILTSILFFIQGLSFVWWWMLHKNYSFWVRYPILLILLFIPILSMGLVMVGIVDIVIDLREKMRRNSK